MSWNGTVRCGHCYETGHNKRSCPQLTETLRKRALQEIENGEGKEAYWGRQYAKRTGEYADGTSAKAMKQGRRDAGRQRRCTWCGKLGHNKRTCDLFKADKAKFAERTLEVRRQVLAAMQREGLGVGTLLKCERSWNNTILMYMVVGVNWDAFAQDTVRGHGRLLQVKSLKNMAASADHLALPALNDEEGNPFNEYNRSDMQIASPVEGAWIQAPEGFLSEAAVAPLVNEHFANKDLKSETYWNNVHGY